MHKRHGFTIIELAITIVVIGILLTLSIVGFQRYQVSARDQERQADVAALQNYLESIYIQEIRDASGTVIKPANSYPFMPYGAYSSTAKTINPYDNANFSKVMEGVPKQVVTVPGQSDISLRTPRQKYQICTEMTNCYTYPENASAIAPDIYVYTATNASRGFGWHGCVENSIYRRCGSYVISYVLESDPNTLQRAESKRK